ncbi:hypothetical protein [Sphingomonas sp.]|uniref:hypothetical protein n=1 Tax=Sphingomonas sp. TaxID=28214 RepID=UPI003CC6CEBD
MAGAAVAVMVRRARQEIVHHFTEAGATAPERSVPFDPDALGRHQRIRRRVFRRMRDFGAIGETKPGRFYLDEDRLAAFQTAMKRRALGLVALATGAVAAIGAIAALG